MEEHQEKTVRKFRGKIAILKLLQQQLQSSQSVKSFCPAHGIAEGTLHNWKNRYSQAGGNESGNFTPLHIISEPCLFAIVGNIRIYQPVRAAYLKELQS